MGRFQPFSEMCCTNGTQLASRNSRNRLILLVLSNCHAMFPKKLNVAAHPGPATKPVWIMRIKCVEIGIGRARLCGAIPGVELATGWRFLR